MLTRQNYKVLADILNYHFPQPPPLGAGNLHDYSTIKLEAILKDLCAYLKLDNRRFDKAKFLEAVYKEGKHDCERPA